MIEGDRETFGKAITVVKTLLIENNNRKFLDQNRIEKLDDAFGKFSEIDQQFLQSIIMYCARQRQNFIAETQKPFDELDDEE